MTPGKDRLSPGEDSPVPPPGWQRHAFVGVPRVVTALLMLAGIGINFANVVSRYLFDFAVFWAEEIMVFVIVWCVFLGAVAVAFDGAHLKMDLLSARIASPWREIVNGIAAAAFIGCCGYAAFQSSKVLRLLADGGDVSVAASVPMLIPHAALFAGSLLMALAVLFRLRAYLCNRF